MLFQTLSECTLTLKMIHLKRVSQGAVYVNASHGYGGTGDSLLCVMPFLYFKPTCVLPQGPEFIQFLQQEYLPSLHVSPEITQVRFMLKRACCVGICIMLRFIAQGVWVLDTDDFLDCLSFLQELCQVLQQPDTKVLRNYMKVSCTPSFSIIFPPRY